MLKKGSFFKVSALVMVVLLFVIGYLYFKKSKINADSILATSSTIVLSDKTDWDQGTLTNIDSTTSAGSIKMNEKAGGAINLDAIYQADNSRLSSTSGESSEHLRYFVHNPGGNVDSTWPSQSSLGSEEFNIDLGDIYRVSAIPLNDSCNAAWNHQPPWDLQTCSQVPYSGGVASRIYLSLNGVDYNLVVTKGGFSSTDLNPITPTLARYVRVTGDNLGYNPADRLYYGWDGFAVHQTHPLTKHITGATQIDGGENFWSWESFTPAESVTGTTSVSYRYRSSPDGATWTSWVSGIGLVTSRVGDTKYRYLQVEASLDNTDGATTPSIDQYNIGYHTEIKPVAPSAQTAVIQ